MTHHDQGAWLMMITATMTPMITTIMATRMSLQW